jgi:integrase
MARKQIGSLFRKTPGAARWSGAYYDPFASKRRTVLLFTDKQASRRRLSELIALAERKRTGLVDPGIEHHERPIRQHIEEYLNHCRFMNESEVHVANKKSQLDRLVKGTSISRVTELDVNRVATHLQNLAESGRKKKHESGKEAGLSARSVNQHRATFVAFAAWCVVNGRLPSNPLKLLPKQDERRDRRHVRRAFSEEELSRLFRSKKGRGDVYRIAVFTGLRKGELGKLTWADIEWDTNTVRIRANVGKSRRDDEIPLHPEAAAAFKRVHPTFAQPSALVFPVLPNNVTFRRDLKSAGIPVVDDSGRCVDFHALRTTTGTLLARVGVPPQIASRIMRHSDLRITMKHYTMLTRPDYAREIGKLGPMTGTPGKPEEASKATGTFGISDNTHESTLDRTCEGTFDSTSGGIATGTITGNAGRSTANAPVYTGQNADSQTYTAAMRDAAVTAARRECEPRVPGNAPPPLGLLGFAMGGPEEVAPKEALGGRNSASADTSVRKAEQTAGSLRLTNAPEEPSQSFGDSIVGKAVRQGARRGRGDLPKLPSLQKCRAIGAVG